MYPSLSLDYNINYSLAEHNEHTPNDQIHEIPETEQAQSTASPYDDQDLLLINPEQNSFDQSEEESDEDDITAAAAEVNSINQQLEDVCTALHCINENMSAQCNNPIH